MPIQILMPSLSPTMTEGKLAKWIKGEGEAIESGDVIAEIETDKATMEIEAIDDGVLGKILITEGTDGVPVNQVIGLILEEGENSSALNDAATAPPLTSSAELTPTVEPTAAAEPSQSATPTPRLTEPKSRVFASPLARRMAKQLGLDISAVAGSGPHGRIVKRDIEAAMTGGAPSPTTARPSTAPTLAPLTLADGNLAGLPPYREVANSSMRKVVARRLSESKQQVPHFYLTVDCEIDKLLALRKELNDQSPDGDSAYKLSVNDLVIRAAAMALMKVPAANAMWTEEAILEFERADISVAVAIKGGLITPVVRNANGKGLLEISNEVKELAAKARDGSLMPEAYQGGTFTISNLGMYGIKQFEPIINPPQGAILAVGAGQQRPVVKDGALAIATVMSCSLSVDHRVVDGAIGAEFLAAFKLLIEAPITMLL
ncbi:MAG: pyruvate dehydrogenase complex dihydrolipoamide acetyltransferase [Rhodospirillales bacterium]